VFSLLFFEEMGCVRFVSRTKLTSAHLGGQTHTNQCSVMFTRFASQSAQLVVCVQWPRALHTIPTRTTCPVVRKRLHCESVSTYQALHTTAMEAFDLRARLHPRLTLCHYYLLYYTIAKYGLFTSCHSTCRLEVCLRISKRSFWKSCRIQSLRLASHAPPTFGHILRRVRDILRAHNMFKTT
jgi:hypothetical protein